MIRILLTLLLLGVIATQQGCWDHREVERLGIVMATGVDLAPEGRVRVIVQNINPGALGKGMAGGMGGITGTSNKPYLNRSIEGETMFDAIRELSRQTPRQLFFAHNQVILISEKLVRERGVREVMDFFERNPQIRRTTWLLVGKGDMNALMDEPGRLEGSPAQRIFGIISERELSSQYAAQRLGDFLETMESESTQPYTAVLERIPNKAVTEEHKNRLAEGHIAEPHQNMIINGTAVFRRDKMAGWLNSKESRGLLWIRGKVKGGIIEIPGPEGKGGSISLEILRSKTKMKPELRDGSIYMSVSIKEESNLGEATVPLDLTKPEIVKELEDIQNQAIRKEIESALTRAQQDLRVDVFGFGEAVHRQYPRQWKEMKKNWQDLFPAVQVEVEVDSKIRRTGMITKPPEPKQK
ncbi:MAG: Ger(x)C family spore germination protein [Firmicutes bacterium]|nr:Ger(x)C family spore germination protein [Bacillota bacterium]